MKKTALVKIVTLIRDVLWSFLGACENLFGVFVYFFAEFVEFQAA